MGLSGRGGHGRTVDFVRPDRTSCDHHDRPEKPTTILLAIARRLQTFRVLGR